ncbi:MAG: hypothetical protein JNK90_26585 [Planctomycetaceae bacterium]|nr:hypothetical protein [Planctomycetaceae bacterium]MBN8604537.1 hypothetical protein [Planctomycetota bacterium]
MKIPVIRNVVEYSLIILWWLAAMTLFQWWSEHTLFWNIVVVCVCWFKSIFFGRENLTQLYDAARSNLSHHRFLVLMAINMTQMILSFALDFHLLYLLDPDCFAGVAPDVHSAEAIFDFFYLSTLNFSFFGYSDILPETVPAKIINLTEIVLAFITVIFLLSDYVSLKESLRDK